MLACAAVFTAPARATVLATPLVVHPFAPSPVWNTPLLPTAALDSKSKSMISGLKAAMAAHYAAGQPPTLAIHGYGPPIYQVPPTTPLVKVKLDPTGAWADSLRAALSSGVPIPAGALPAGGTDGTMVIYQPSSDTYWEFWRAYKQSGTWHAGWGGVIRHISLNPGYFTTADAPDGWKWGAAATGLPLADGLITPEELRAGVIDHAIALALGDACAAYHVFPAQRNDGHLTTTNCIPEGARLRLPMTLDLAAMNLPKATFAIARAAQLYGLVVTNTDGGQPMFGAEDTAWTGIDEYTGPLGALGGVAPYQIAKAFPWSQLQVLKTQKCTTGQACRGPLTG